ncbi:MAG: hypothetical protein IJ521_03260, partial [Schwartzia sp.]|nr:hypothetical protein [Schwartzia sp. (in: firmicutes)]
KRGNRPQPIPVPEPSEVPEETENKKSLLDVEKKIFVWIKPLDFVIMIVGGIMISRVDFSNVTLVDVIYMTTFLMWFLFLLARIYFTRLNRAFQGKD